MLQAQQICKEYGTTKVVNGLNLSVESGQICGLLGPNGAGKSTSIRMICGVLAPTSGSIKIAGFDISKKPSQAKQVIGYVPEGAPLPLEMLPVEFLKTTASIYGITGKQKIDAISEWAERCDIADVLRKPIGSLSRGYRQRVALASSLLHQPKLVVLDEPSTGLDPMQRSSFHDLLREVSSNAAVLYSSHHLSEVESTCDSIAIINHGKRIANYSCDVVKEEETQIVEVSSIEVASSIGATVITKLEGDWVRCSIEQPREKIAGLVQESGGSIRLLKPAEKTLESIYVELINNESAQE